ncbi:zinc-binding dehydrogenase [Actinomyces qiguomingii]|uniref:zinc-binding dehydrogenase n=1 Tax=Actinomyces qiguomingii TaxID=2057800 RepID=UPI0018EA8967|nr:zinc-binding dehydrogenase [Actinomyces qiguomingii]
MSTNRPYSLTATGPATPATMRAAVLTAPGIENLHVTNVPVPQPRPGWVRIKVMAFGLNRSEYHSVTGQAGGMSYPRVLGIEASGIVDLDPQGRLPSGTQVVTMMGGMGRAFDGGYAQYVVVPREQVLTFDSGLPWEVIGSVPETLQTAHGSLTTGLNLQAGQSLLIRGGTSALGLATAALAVDMGCTVYATSRRRAGLELLASRGVTALRDDGAVAEQVRGYQPGGVDAVLELVGVPTLRDSLLATAVHGTVCFTGMLSDSWTITEFYPMDWIPNGVRLTTYSGQASDLPAAELQRVLDRIEAGVLNLLPVHTYPLDEIVRAQQDMAACAHTGKLVGLPWA